jgi:hypothetical protein
MRVASIKSDSPPLRVVSFTNRMIANVGVQHRIMRKESHSRLISFEPNFGSWFCRLQSRLRRIVWSVTNGEEPEAL